MNFVILILLICFCAKLQGQEKFFEVPKSKFIVLNSGKLRIEIRKIDGVSGITFDGNINEPIDRIQGGKIRKKLSFDVVKNLWSVNLDVKVKSKDIVNYFLTVRTSNVDKRFYASHVVKGELWIDE